MDECEGRSEAVLVVRIEREVGWCMLWDCGRDNRSDPHISSSC